MKILISIIRVNPPVGRFGGSTLSTSIKISSTFRFTRKRKELNKNIKNIDRSWNYSVAVLSNLRTQWEQQKFEFPFKSVKYKKKLVPTGIECPRPPCRRSSSWSRSRGPPGTSEPDTGIRLQLCIWGARCLKKKKYRKREKTELKYTKLWN